MFRRLRARLDRVEGHAHMTMNDVQALVADLQDGFGVTIDIDENAISALLDAMRGKATKLPLTIKVDPTIDTKG